MCVGGSGTGSRSGSLCSHASRGVPEKAEDPVHRGVDYVIKEGQSRWCTLIKVGAN